MGNTEDTIGAPSDNFIVKDTKNTKDQLGVMALKAIMEWATESQAFRVSKQPLKGQPSKKTKVL